nr:putative lrr receptor-like serine/threonine-protein kinase [Quercus suber]
MNPVDSDFAIKCGGPQITSSNGIVYEWDNETVGPSTYYEIDTDRWAVSNVGYFGSSNDAQYTRLSLSQFTNALDSELFQTARLSASSLIYYGLGLENGNYTVSLQFAETAFGNSNTWKSLGRRVFDIYIQGNLVLKDFDIRKDAGGASFVAVQKEYNAVQVSGNYLEILLYWAGKGTCCVPAQGTYGPSISAISATPEFTPTVSNRPPNSNKNRTGLVVGLIVGVGVLSFLAVFVFFYIVRRRKPPANDDEELLGIDAKTFTFSYAELKTATEDFSPDNKLGEGGFGPVHKEGEICNSGRMASRAGSIYPMDAKAISSSRVSEEKGSINRPGPGSNGWHAFTENIEHSFERKAVSPPIISNRVTTPESSIPVAVELDDSTTAPKLSIRTSEFLDEIPLFNEDDTVANEDRLSALPNELKLLVLFFLADESYTRDVIQTSALSRGWGNLWSSVPYLHFRDMRRSDLLDDIDNTLRQYLGRKLERFNVHYNFANPHHKPNVDSWNSFAASA